MSDEPRTDDVPTGLPEEEPEATPLGVPEDEDAPEPGADAMPGIVTDEDPPDAG